METTPTQDMPGAGGTSRPAPSEESPLPSVEPSVPTSPPHSGTAYREERAPVLGQAPLPAAPATPSHKAPATRATLRRRLNWPVVIPLVALAVVALLVLLSWWTSRPNALEKASDNCSTWANMQDGGSAISFDTQGNDDTSGDKAEDMLCVLDALNTPEHVMTHIDATRAMDGQQTDAWSNLTARWSYHPDSGVILTIVQQ